MLTVLTQQRWWIYQRERFPVFAHGALIAAFSFSAVSFSLLLRGEAHWPMWGSALTAFISSFLFFLLLRIADEFKDFEDDARYRPYRPVPRGLVSLRELGGLALIAGALQFIAALVLDPALTWILLGVWLYLLIMSKEFFVAAWLKRHPLTYLWSHMLIMPLIDFYATACDWLVAGAGAGAPPHGLFWFLIVSFFNGVVIEIGRKLRAPQDEEHGVETYTFLWGRQRAVFAWLAALGITAASAYAAARLIDFALPVAVLLIILLLIAGYLSWRFLRLPSSGLARWFEKFSGLWTIAMYLSLGVVPLLLRV